MYDSEANIQTPLIVHSKKDWRGSEEEEEGGGVQLFGCRNPICLFYRHNTKTLPHTNILSIHFFLEGGETFDKCC